MPRHMFFILIVLPFFIAGCVSHEEFPVVLQFEIDCYSEELVPGDVLLEIETKEFVLIRTKAELYEIGALKQNSCLIDSFQPKELPLFLEQLKQDFEEQRDADLEERKIQRTLEDTDVIDKEDLEVYLEEKHKELPTGTISQYQLYVTPDAASVQELAAELDGIQEIYDEALSWIWVSEEELNGVPEYWYTPEEFLVETAFLDTNPIPGRIASDCSEQANTLASVLIADGYPEQNVRVVLGKVNFNGEIGGHAWVEIYEDGRWIPLEATAGAYYDSSTGSFTEASSIPYDYFMYYSFPSVEIWYYYNNVFFYDVQKEKGIAPEHWLEASQDWLEEDLGSLESAAAQAPERNGSPRS